MTKIPVIDLQSYNGLDLIDEAYTKIGFALFANVLNDEDQFIMNSWFDIVKSFFESPSEYKNKYISKSGMPTFGYKNPNHLKQIFDFQNLNETENLWPDILSFKETAIAAQNVAKNHTLKMFKIFDTILDSGTTLVEAHTSNCNPLEFSRVLRYPSYDGPIKDGQMRIEQHRDYGTITSIWQINNTLGLEVQNLNRDWLSVPYVENGVVVNVGDLLQRWSNDYFISTEHRVNCSHMYADKYSMPHFAHPKTGTIISNLRKNETTKYEDIESKEYLMQRVRKKQ